MKATSKLDIRKSNEKYTHCAIERYLIGKIKRTNRYVRKKIDEFHKNIISVWFVKRKKKKKTCAQLVSTKGHVIHATYEIRQLDKSIDRGSLGKRCTFCAVEWKNFATRHVTGEYYVISSIDRCRCISNRSRNALFEKHHLLSRASQRDRMGNSAHPAKCFSHEGIHTIQFVKCECEKITSRANCEGDFRNSPWIFYRRTERSTNPSRERSALLYLKIILGGYYIVCAFDTDDRNVEWSQDMHEFSKAMLSLLRHFRYTVDSRAR